jgi:hypothetical protein
VAAGEVESHEAGQNDDHSKAHDEAAGEATSAVEIVVTEQYDHEAAEFEYSNVNGDQGEAAYEVEEVFHSVGDEAQEQFGDAASYEHEVSQVGGVDDTSAYENSEGAEGVEAQDLVTDATHLVEEHFEEHELAADGQAEHLNTVFQGSYHNDADPYDENAELRFEEGFGLSGDDTTKGDEYTHLTGGDETPGDEFEIGAGLDDGLVPPIADSPKSGKRLRAESEVEEAGELGNSGECIH